MYSQSLISSDEKLHFNEVRANVLAGASSCRCGNIDAISAVGAIEWGGTDREALCMVQLTVAE